MMMKRKIILGGVCATGIAVAAMLSVVSCSGDDEYYERGNYTLARKRVTRSAEHPSSQPPSLSVKYRSGNEDVEVVSEFGRLNFNVSWTGGNMDNIHVNYIDCDNTSGYTTYTDCLGVERKVYNKEVVKVEKIGNAKLCGNVIIAVFQVTYTQSQKTTDNCGHQLYDRGGCPVYVQGPRQKASVNVELDITSYREKDGYIGNY